MFSVVKGGDDNYDGEETVWSGNKEVRNNVCSCCGVDGEGLSLHNEFC